MIRTLALAAGLGALALPAHPQATDAGAPPAGRTLEVRLQDLECGDNCWLGYLGPDGEPGSALCNAAPCEDWMLAGALPEALVGRRARLALQPGQAMSGDVVMAEAEAAVEVELLDGPPAPQPFGSGGVVQGMTRAEVAAAVGAPIAPGLAEVEVEADGRPLLVGFCGDRVHDLRAVAADGVEWLSALEWLHGQGFALAPPELAALDEEGGAVRRELVHRLASPEAPYRVEARMVALSSPEGASLRFELAFASSAACTEGP